MKKLSLIGLLVLVIAATAIGGCVFFQPPVPQTLAGKPAEKMASQLLGAVNQSAWDKIEAVTWDFGGRQTHIWDKSRHFAQVSWDEHRVLINTNTQRGVAYTDGEKVENSEELIQEAWAHFCNDSFWLNPVIKIKDGGTTRGVSDWDDEGNGLLVSYGSGGVTPGDAYLWKIGEDGRPTHWRMWTQILPIQGLEATWENWIQLEGGAWVSTKHEIGPVTLELTDIKAGTASALNGGKDPFAELELAPESQPSTK